MLSADDSAVSSTPATSHVEHVRAVALGHRLSSLGRGWIKIGASVYALRSNSPQHVDTSYCPSETLMWLRTTLIRLQDGTWQLEEFRQGVFWLHWLHPFNLINVSWR